MTRFICTDRWGRYKGEVRAYKAVRTRATDGTDELELSTVEPVDKGDRILFVDSMGRFCEYTAEQPRAERAGSRGGCTVRCSGSMLSDLSLRKVEDTEATFTPSQALGAALSGTGWTPGRVDAGKGSQAVVWHEMTALGAVRDICDVYGLEVEQRITVDGPSVTGRYVELKSRRGRDTTRRFEYGRDLAGVRRTVSSTPVYTRLYCYGQTLQGDENKTSGGYSKRVDITSVNGGVPYVEDTEATAIWGLPDGKGGKIAAEGIYENGDCEDPAQLLAEGRGELSRCTEPEVSYEADVVALSRAGFDADGVDVGDGVQIVDTAFPGTVRLEGRVLQIEENLLGGLADTTITLGNIKKSLTQQNAEAQEAIDRLTGSAGSWDSAATVQDSFINSVINGVNSVLNEVGGYAYLVPGKGLFVYDRPMDDNPTMAIMMGGGFLRIADDKTSQGEWEWRTAATGRGLVADELVVGVITGGSNSWNLETGDLIFEQGIIRDAQGNNYWNMTTGDFKLSPGALVGSSEIGKTTVSTEVQYGHSPSASVEPTDWGSDGTWRQGEYLWSRVKCTAIDGTVTYEGEKIIANDKGMGGVTTPQWYLSDSSTAQHGGSWQDSQPTWVKDHYYWTRNKTTWSDGTTTYDTPVLAQGVTSANQAVNDLDESLDVEGVFNRLTANGSIKGIYMQDGQLYINASYIMSGIINADLIKAGRITSKTGGTYWDLDTGEMVLDFSGVEQEIDDAVGDLSSRVTTAQNRADSAYLRAGTAINDAADAYDRADSAYDRATSAKTKTDKITFTDSGINVRGTDGKTYKTMTLSPDGLINDGSITDLKTAQAVLGIKDWGIVYENNSGTARFWVSNNRDEIYMKTSTAEFRVTKDGGWINGKKITTA